MKTLYTKNNVWDLCIFSAAVIIVIYLSMIGGLFGNIGEKTLELTLPGIIKVSVPSGHFILHYLITFIFCFILLLYFPSNYIDYKKSVLIIISVSVALRFFLLSHEASDDIYRYLWEGKLLSEDISPWLYSPDSPTLSELASSDKYHSLINHPDIPAGYPPFVIFLFSIAGWVHYSTTSIKLLVLLFDVGTVYLLIIILKEKGADVRWAVLYAFNPLILYSFSGQGHYDSIQVFFLLLCLLCYLRKKWIMMFLLAGLSIQTKYVTVLSIPFFINRENYRYSWLVLVTMCTPYILFQGNGVLHFFYGILKFGREFAFNGSVHHLLRLGAGNIYVATKACSLFLILFLTYGYYQFHPDKKNGPDDPNAGILYSIGAFLIFAPTIHPWYITWIIPFAIIRQKMSWILLSGTISFYFVVNGQFYYTGVWKLPLWAWICQWTVFYAFISFEVLCFFYRLGSKTPKSAISTLSVVIPAKNESENITGCIEAISLDDSVNEIIVVDGGSNDNTVALSEKSGAKVIVHNAVPEKGGGRGGQILRGIKESTGDIIAIVHADTVTEPGVFGKIINHMQRDPEISGGAVGCRFRKYSVFLTFIQFLNNLKVVLFGISFGDQIQFFRREPVIINNTFPDIPLMEDVEFSIRLHKLGRQIFLFGDAGVSSRRWEKFSGLRLVNVIVLVGAYLCLRIWKLPDTLKMYRWYYRKR